VGPFSLTDYLSVAKRAKLMVEVTGSRFMPPWKPDERYGPKLVGDRRLSDEQIELLRQWAESGATEGEGPLSFPLPPTRDGWQLGEPDLIVRADAPYLLQSEGTDVFRNLVIRVPNNEPKYIRALEFKPGNLRVVHHAILRLDRSAASRQLDLEDAEVGFGGMEISTAAIPDGHLIGWTPGQRPYEAYPGVAEGGSQMFDVNTLPLKPSTRGGGRRYFDRATAMCERYEMHVTQLHKKGPSHDPHSHIETEIILVIAGETGMMIDGEHYEGTVGDFYLMEANLPHGVSNASDEKACSYFAFKWN